MNSRYLLLSIIFLLGLTNAKAQVDTLSANDSRKLILSISAGVAFPIGKFSTFEINPEAYIKNISGNASTGYNGKLQIVYIFSKYLGLSLTAYSSANKGKAVDAADILYDPCSGCKPFGGLGVNSHKTFSDYETKSWLTSSVLAGMVINVLRDNPIISLRVNGGAQKVRSPESKYSESGSIWRPHLSAYFPYSSNIFQPSMTSINFCFDLGMDLQISLIKRIGLVVSMDFLTSHSSYTGLLTYSGYYYDGFSQQVYYEKIEPLSFTKNVSLFNLNIGLSYLLK